MYVDAQKLQRSFKKSDETQVDAFPNSARHSDQLLRQQTFSRLLAGIHDEEEWESFTSFIYSEVKAHNKKKRKPIITNTPDFVSSILTPKLINALSQRLWWILGLMILMSFSSFIMDYYSEMLNRHLIVATFVTTLIGTGGNAGNQAGSLVISSVAAGELAPTRASLYKLVKQESYLGMVMAIILAFFMFIRSFLASFDGAVSLALSLSMFFIVTTSVLIGTIVPIILMQFDLDPAKGAAPILATVMDLLGVTIACVVCSYLLPGEAQIPEILPVDVNE